MAASTNGETLRLGKGESACGAVRAAVGAARRGAVHRPGGRAGAWTDASGSPRQPPVWELRARGGLLRRRGPRRRVDRIRPQRDRLAVHAHAQGHSGNGGIVCRLREGGVPCRQLPPSNSHRGILLKIAVVVLLTPVSKHVLLKRKPLGSSSIEARCHHHRWPPHQPLHRPRWQALILFFDPTTADRCITSATFVGRNSVHCFDNHLSLLGAESHRC